MASYDIQFRRSVRKDFKHLPPKTAERIWSKIEGLEENPRPPGAASLEGDRPLWRIRIGDYRLVYEIDDKARVVMIHYVRHRKDVYRDL